MTREQIEKIHMAGEMCLAHRLVSRLDAGLWTMEEMVAYLREEYIFDPCDHPGHTPQGGPCGCEPDPHDFTPEP